MSWFRRKTLGDFYTNQPTGGTWVATKAWPPSGQTPPIITVPTNQTPLPPVIPDPMPPEESPPPAPPPPVQCLVPPCPGDPTPPPAPTIPTLPTKIPGYTLIAGRLVPTWWLVLGGLAATTSAVVLWRRRSM